MKINKVMFNDFKNKKGSQALTGFDLFVGKNGTGKSSVLQAIELAVTGGVEGILTPKNIFKYSKSDSEMSVGIETNDGFNISRAYIRKVKTDKETGDISVSYSEKLKTPSNSTSNKVKQEEIKNLIGDFPISFDFNQFTSMTDTEKRNFILSFCNSKVTEEEVRDYLLSTKDENLDDEIFFNAVDELLDESSTVKGDNIQKKVETMLSLAKEQLSYYKKEVERQRITIQKLSEKKSSFTISDKGLALDKKKAEKLNEELISLEKEISVIESENKRSLQVIDRLSKLEGEIKSLLDSKPSKSLSEVQKDIDKCKKGLKTLNDESVGISKKLETISVDFNILNNKVKTQRISFDGVKSKGTELKTIYNTQAELVKQVMGTKGKCAINPTIPCNANFNSWLQEKKVELNSMANSLKELAGKYKEEESLLKDTESKLESLNKERETLISNQQELLKRINQGNQMLSSSEKLEEELKAFDKVKAEKIKAKEEEIKALTVDKKDVVDTVARKEKLNSLRNEISELKNIISQKEQLKSLVAQIKESNEEFTSTEKKFEVYKHLVKFTGQKGLQGEIFKKLVSPMVDLINKNLEVMNIDRKFYISTTNDQDSEVFHFGLESEEEKIDFDTLSTGQQVILSIAMVVAFMEKANLPMKVLCIDNLESLDNVNAAKVVNGLEFLYNNEKIDNILIAGCMDSYPKASYKVWEM